MNYYRYFFICSCLFLIFAGVNYSIGPLIYLSKYDELDTSYASLNCKKIYDDLERTKKESYFTMTLYEYEESLNAIKYCRYVVGMHTMEYMSFNINVVFGFIFVLIGIFGFQEAKIPKGNFISMICGIIGFLSTLTYIIISGTVFTQIPLNDTYKRESDGSVAEYEELKGYRCYYFSSVGDKSAFMAKFSDLMKSQYNYNKELMDSYKDEKKQKCTLTHYSDYINTCATEGYLKLTYLYDDCQKLYYYYDKDKEDETISPILYDLSVKFLCTLIISVFMLPCYLAIIFFAFNLSKDSSGYTQI